MDRRCVAYLRRSSEQEDRQALSLPAQEEEIRKLAKKLNLSIEKIFQESKSAKKPGREQFNDLVSYIQSGKANTILVWHPNRLSRNSVDAGALIYMLDLKQLHEIITPQKSYANMPMYKFMLQFEMGQAKYENDNKGIDVKRGMNTKAKMGWYPAPAPIGYKNTPHKKMGFKTIVKDRKRFPYLQEAWFLVLKGRRPIEVWEDLCQKWIDDGNKGLFVSRSPFYRMLEKPFYYGQFEWPSKSGNWYTGKHKPMITKEIFDLVQKKVKNTNKPLRNKHYFPYKGLFYCGDCGHMVTGYKKIKHVKTDDEIREYDYYRCTHKSLKQDCLQKPITQTNMSDQLSDIVSRIKVPKDFLMWAKKWNAYLEENEINTKEDKAKSQQEEIDQIKTKKQKLLEKLMDELIDDEQYKVMKKKYDDQILEIEQSLLTQKIFNDREDIIDQLEFAHTVKEKFDNGEDKDKRRVVEDLGLNYSLKDKKVAIQLKKTYFVLSKIPDWSKLQKDRFELNKYADVLAQKPDLKPSNPAWLPGRDSNPEDSIQSAA